MDREKERLEQEAYNQATRRRYKRKLLRAYMQACMNYFVHAPDPKAVGLAKLELISHGHQLKLLGFRRFSKLRAHAKAVRHGKATVKRPF